MPLFSSKASADYNFDNIYKRFQNTDSEKLTELGVEYINRQRSDRGLAVFTILANRYDGRDMNRED
ncbi:MAG: hypothetical protein K2F91_03350, partial [Muribaculaceae bacterium]|nr:hypothetical protein [Muribaculaceae bacterium]